jgi:hypothetical protein
MGAPNLKWWMGRSLQVRPWEAPSLAKIQIFGLKGGNFLVQTVEGLSHAFKIFKFPCYFPKFSAAQALFHHIHACMLIFDDLTIPNLHLLKSYPSHFSSERKPNQSVSQCECHQCLTLSPDPLKW